MLPALKKAVAYHSSEPFGSRKAAVVNMTSVLGSIELNNDGGLYPYRCSKVITDHLIGLIIKDYIAYIYSVANCMIIKSLN